MIGCGIRERKNGPFGAGGFLRRNEGLFHRKNFSPPEVFSA
jgi:hypothetical protein